MISFVLLADTIRIENRKRERKMENWLKTSKSRRVWRRQKGWGREEMVDFEYVTNRNHLTSHNVNESRNVGVSTTRRRWWCTFPIQRFVRSESERDVAEQFAYMAIRCRADLLDAKWHAVFGFPSFLRKMVSVRLQKVRMRPLLTRRTIWHE